MTSLTPPTRPPAKRDALRVAVRQLRFQRVIAARPVFLLAILALFLGSVSVAHAQTTAPTVSTVAVTSNPGTDDTYALGDTIEVGLTFSEAVTATGAPYLLIDVGGTKRRADYNSGTGATQLKFQYTVLAGDDDDDGIAVVANSLTLNGGSIVATDDSTAATLDHAALTTTAHKVDIVAKLFGNLQQTPVTPDPDIYEEGSVTLTAGEEWATIFTPGTNGHGYTLTDIVLDIGEASAGIELRIEIDAGITFHKEGTDGVLLLRRNHSAWTSDFYGSGGGRVLISRIQVQASDCDLRYRNGAIAIQRGQKRHRCRQ